MTQGTSIALRRGTEIALAESTRDIAGYHGAELIGRGGFGAVYRATDADHGRDVAIKVLPGGLDDTGRRRFDRERQTMGRLGAHPNIVPVYESGYTDDGEAYIVMELATGGSLRSRLAESGAVPWREAVEMIAAIASAAQAAHDNGVLHRDIKPDNILVDHFGNPKLTDFGIAAVASNATTTSSTTATLAHAAPELLNGDPSTPAVDIYALGSTLYAIAAGRSPFQGGDNDTVTSLIGRVLTQPPPDIRRYGVPDAVARVIERALAKDPSQRQRSAAELAADLRAALTAGPDTAGRTVAVNDLAPPPVDRQHPGTAPTGRVGPASSQTTSIPGGGVAGPEPFTTGVHALDGVSSRAASAGDDVRRGAGGWLFVATAIVVLAGIAGAVWYTLLRSPDTDVASGGEPANAATETSSITPEDTDSSAPASQGDGPSLSVDCPSVVALNVETICSIVTGDGATSGAWRLPGFLAAPEDLLVVPGESEIFIEPTDPASVGRTFTITVTATAAGGAETTVEHRFEVQGPTVEINCPAEITLGDSVVCEVVSANATSGEWNIDSFGSDVLETVPGSNPLFIEPTNPSAVGGVFTITATVRDSNGLEATETFDFTVTGG